MLLRAVRRSVRLRSSEPRVSVRQDIDDLSRPDRSESVSRVQPAAWLLFLCLTAVFTASAQAVDQDLTELDRANPWFPDGSFPALRTPDWIGEQGVDAVVVFAIDDMRDSARYEQYLRPILNRLKRIDGRAPVSIMACDAKPDDPQLQSWLEEGLSLECHTADHPCPLLHDRDIEIARSTYDRCVDLLAAIPGNHPVAFRTPCCDSLNTVSPRFYAEIFSGRTERGNFLQIDTSVFNFFTSADEEIPRPLVLESDGTERFLKYMPRNNNYKGMVHDQFVNTIRNYPYPYLINGCCWQFPCVAPSDWSAQHLHGVNNPKTVEDWKAALDITVVKQGVFCLVFHPHGWIEAEQIVELIDHAVAVHGDRVRFLNFREAADRLNAALCSDGTIREISEARRAELAHTVYRHAHPAPSDFRSLSPRQRTALAASAPRVMNSDGTHSGAFLHGDAVCWQNETTDALPNLISRQPLAELTAAYHRAEQAAELPPIPVGAARKDITPDYPVRLSGYAGRTTEATEVSSRIHARAVAIGGDLQAPETTEETALIRDQPLSLLLTVDSCGVPASMAEEVYARLAEHLDLQRAHFAVSSSHTHSAPWLRDFAPLILNDLPPTHAEHLALYEQTLIEQLVAVALAAVKARTPAYLSLSHGHAGFAKNRRSLQSGQWVGFGESEDGPVDRRLSVLSARRPDGELLAVLSNYACHATTETGQFNRISGDWPGYACAFIESAHPDAVALVAIGCGTDANPSPRGSNELSQQHGRELADEVERLLSLPSAGASADEPGEFSRRIDPRIRGQLTRIALPHGPLPTRAEWEERAQRMDATGRHARYFLAQLEAGKGIPDSIADYPVQTWQFGEDLAMVFLAGEVVVDYDIRMNDMFDGERLWINAYSNDVPCYIASKRILREGGYEADSSMLYYARPTRLSPEAEDLICDAVQQQVDHTFYSESLRADFPAPVPPDQAVATFTVRPGLSLELVAAEPLIRDPVAFDWDVNGRLWVVEMGDYPSGRAEAPEGGGRIRVLEDTDHDGQYDRGTTYLDGLPFPTGVCRWRDGILITAAPDIIYARDVDGDLKSDIQQVLYTGFGEGNQQHRVNGLRWGLDGWLYVGNGDSGGQIRAVGRVLPDPSGEAGPGTRQVVNVRGRDIRIEPDTGRIDTVAGATQFGRERDDFGNWFGNNNSNPIWHYALEEQRMRRNPHFAAGSLRREIAVVAGAAPVFPTSRTLARFNDFYAANRFTSACSTSIFRDTCLGEEFYGNAFVCEPVHNLVSRLVLDRDGASFAAHRAEDEQQSEFLSSTDNWFRPTMVRTGPDGCLYVSDMYRLVIEHPTWIPQEYQRKLNLRAGEQRGRIYRVVRSGACCGTDDNVVAAAGAADTDSADSSWIRDSAQDVSLDVLLARLVSRNGWWRDTAQRLLMHRVSHPELVPEAAGAVRLDRADVARRIVAKLSASPLSPAAVCQGLACLRTLAPEVTDPDAVRVVQTCALQHLAHHNAWVKTSALRLLERWIEDEAVVSDAVLQQVAHDTDPAVRLQFAYVAGSATRPLLAELLGALLADPATDEIVRAAGFSSLNEASIALVMDAAAVARDQSGDPVMFDLVEQALALGHPSAVMRLAKQMLSRLAQRDRPTDAADWRTVARLVRQLRPNLSGEDAEAISALLEQVQERSPEIVFESDADPQLRAASLDVMTIGRTLTGQEIAELLPLLDPRTPRPVQQAVVAALSGSQNAAAGPALISQWPAITPELRAAIVEAMLSRTGSTTLLLDALGSEAISARDLSAVHRDRLLGHRDEGVRKRAQSLLLGESSSSRGELVRQWETQLAALTGDAVAGQQVFRRRCAACHRLQDIGQSVGADLAALRDRSTPAMLTAILDPNRAVEARFLSYTVVSTDGLTHTGMLLEEGANSVTLIGADGKKQTVLRRNIDELIASQRSLMPEGFEKDISTQEMADVIAFVQSSGTPWKRFDGNQPGMVTPNADGTLTLTAETAELYGPSLVFEQQHRNIGWWQSDQDYVVWNLTVPRSGHWTVQFEYACDNSTAGHLLRLSTGTRMLTARVPGSGTWDDYRTWTAGTIDLHRGERQLTVSTPEPPAFALIDLKAIHLIPPE